MTPAIIALWSTCLSLHAGTPYADASGALWLRHRNGSETLLSWPIEDVGDALVRAAMTAPREMWGVS